MTVFKFEGDIENLNESQIKLVESVLQKRGFTGGNVIVEPVGQKGDNYIALVKRFIYKTNDGATFKMIGKIAPSSEQLRILMHTVILFKNEITMYTNVFPKMNDLQNIAGISETEKIRFPACYGVMSEAPFEFILLEDLKESGFEMLDRFKPLTNDCVRMVLEDLAIFHSLSYAFKNAEPETYKNVTDNMFNLWVLMEGDPGARQYFESVENDIKKITDSEKYKNVITGSVSQIGAYFKKLQSYEKASKYSVIQQGDCWNNNILFRMEDGQPLSNVMIDYQVSRESNPATDILYMLFNCTDHASRLKHFQEWIDYYHESLDNSLANHGLKANRVYPRDQLDADLRRYGKVMVAMGVFFSTIAEQKSEDVVDFTDMTGTEESIEETVAKMQINPTTVKKIKEKVEGVIDTALEFGLI